jgi:hypothetical protein
MPDLSISPTEGRYVIIKPVGSGGMADVYLARDTVLERKVVLKEVRRELANTGDYASMFLDEARVIASLNHPNIVRIYDVGLRDGLPFMALEWLEGWDLRMVEQELDTRHETLELGAVLRLVADAAHGLEAAHTARNDRGVPLRLVHRDVSPHNLFVTTSGVLKLLDFGIAKSSVQSEITGSRMIKGKFAYMAPEQIEGLPVDQRCDVFALGITLHELLAGQPLFGGQSLSDIHDAILLRPIPEPGKLNGNVPDDVVAITMHALEREPSRRFSSAGAMAEAIESSMQSHGLVKGPDDIAATINRVFDGSGPQVWERRATIALGRLDEGSPPAEASEALAAWSEAQGRGDVRTATVHIGPRQGQSQNAAGGRRRPLELVRQHLQNVILGAAALAITGGLLFAALRAIPSPSAVKAAEEATAKARASENNAAAIRAGARSRVNASNRTPAGVGRLTLDTEPMTNVFLDNQELGSTPLTAVVLPAGMVRLRLVNRRVGIDTSITVTIQPGVTLKRRLDLLHEHDGEH